MGQHREKHVVFGLTKLILNKGDENASWDESDMEQLLAGLGDLETPKARLQVGRVVFRPHNS